MENTICINKNFSTTQLLTREKPAIENHPEDKFHSVLFLPKAEERKGEGGLRADGYFKKSYESKPLISIVTVVFNGEKYLEQTILSVIEQSYDNVEYIIVDGGSTDGTIDIIKQHEDQIDYWVSERDDGISDAFNKGIELAHGEFILMLNCGDAFATPTVLADNISKFNNQDLVVFHVKTREVGRRVGIDALEQKNQAHNAHLPHQGTFVHRQIYGEHGLYDKNCKIRMDYDFFLRAVVNSKIRFIHETLVLYDNTGISGQLKYRYCYEKEAICSEHKHLQKNSFYLLKYYYKPLFMTLGSWSKRKWKSLFRRR